MISEEQSEREVHRYIHVCPCCGPTGRSGAIFWGWSLAVIGAAWFLSNLEVLPEDWWHLLIPILVIAWGFSILWSSRNPHNDA